MCANSVLYFHSMGALMCPSLREGQRQSIAQSPLWQSCYWVGTKVQVLLSGSVMIWTSQERTGATGMHQCLVMVLYARGWYARGWYWKCLYCSDNRAWPEGNHNVHGVVQAGACHVNG